jgi:hypothetical protein
MLTGTFQVGKLIAAKPCVCTSASLQVFDNETHATVIMNSDSASQLRALNSRPFSLS